MSVDPQFLINLKGKQFVLLGGLLDLAHRSGLRSIETDVLTELCQPEKEFYVVRAVGLFRTGDGLDATFTALGDAGPGNSQMKGAFLRHAETRALARMLRWATNVAITAFEEVDEAEEKPARKEKPAGPVADSHNLPAKHGPACAVCGLVLDPNTYQASVKRFSQPLCVQHGKERMETLRAEAEAETSGYVQEEAA